MFRVGQKVVSLITFSELWPGEAGPVKDNVYTVREVFLEYDGTHSLRLAEIVNPPFLFYGRMEEATWLSTRFRPVVERKTDISIFTAMLNTSKCGVDA